MFQKHYDGILTAVDNKEKGINDGSQSIHYVLAISGFALCISDVTFHE